MQVVVVSKPDEAPKPKVKEEKAAVPPPVVATGPVSLPAEATEIPKVHIFYRAVEPEPMVIGAIHF